MIETSGACKVQEQKHRELASAIQSLETAVASLDSFGDKVLGCDSVESEPTACNNQSLSVVLNTAPSDIETLTQRIHAAIDRLDGSLF